MVNRRSDDTFRGARNLQFNRTIRESLGQRDRIDFYKFRASGQVDFNLTLSGLQANASVRLLNARRAPVAVSNRSGNRAEQIAATLEGGLYYIQVQFLGRRGTTRYNLRTSATPTPVPPPTPPDSDGTIATAFDIGVLTTTYIKQDTVGANDPVDFYRFTLNDIANLDVRVNGSAAIRSIQLIRDQNNNGLVDSGEVFAPQPSSSLTPLDVPPGTYFIRVEGLSNASSPYELTLVPTFFGGNVSPEPGNTLPLASNTLGVFSGTRVLKEYVGTLDEVDVYRFTLNDLSNLQITRTSSSGNANLNPKVQLIRDSNNNGLIDNDEVFVSDNNFGILSNSARVDVPTGTYFIYVEPKFGSTAYEMTVVGTPYGGNGLPDPGNTLPTARDLGVLSSTSSLKEYVGVLDSDDFYRFTLSNAANLQATLTNSGTTVSNVMNNIQLIQDINNNGLIDNNETLVSTSTSIGTASITRNLQAGNYFIRVRPSIAGFSTNYQVNLTIT